MLTFRRSNILYGIIIIAGLGLASPAYSVQDSTQISNPNSNPPAVQGIIIWDAGFQDYNATWTCDNNPPPYHFCFYTTRRCPGNTQPYFTFTPIKTLSGWGSYITLSIYSTYPSGSGYQVRHAKSAGGNEGAIAFTWVLYCYPPWNVGVPGYL